MCAGAGQKPPQFRECAHRNPCPDAKSCGFGCSLHWWIVAVVGIVFILTCCCAGLRIAMPNINRTHAKEHSMKARASIPAIDIHAYVKAQCSIGCDLQDTPSEVDVPTLLQSVPPEWVKGASSTAPDPVVSAADVELGDVSTQSYENDSQGAFTDDLDKWLKNCDIVVNRGIPAIPVRAKGDAGDSAV